MRWITSRNTCMIDRQRWAWMCVCACAYLWCWTEQNWQIEHENPFWLSWFQTMLTFIVFIVDNQRKCLPLSLSLSLCIHAYMSETACEFRICVPCHVRCTRNVCIEPCSQKMQMRLRTEAFLVARYVRARIKAENCFLFDGLWHSDDIADDNIALKAATRKKITADSIYHHRHHYMHFISQT